MAAFNRPLPAHSEREGRNPNLHSNGGIASSVHQDPSPHGAAQDPRFRSLSQHPIFARPVVYFHLPPPPPLLNYQWPTPFSYNPFAGFPSMGYGSIVPPPPFPPAPYMDVPGYFLPHPPVPPVDYRRSYHPQAHTQGASNQNPYQMYRIPPNHCIPVKETVNSEVQTESAPRSIHGYDVGSESGRGTSSSPPCSPALSSPKQTLTELINCKSPCREDKNLNINEPCTNATVKTSSQKHPLGSNAVESCVRAREDAVMKNALPDQEPVPDTLFKDGTGKLWLSSPDGVAPVSSSSQNNDAVLKERRVSAPGVLMNWGGGMPQALLLETDVELSQNGEQLSHKHEVPHKKLLSHRSTETNTGSVVGVSTAITEGMECLKGSEVLFRILRLPYPMIDTFLECSAHEEPAEASFLERHSLSFRDEVQYWQNSSHNNTAEWQENHIGRYLQGISDVAPHMSDSSCQANRNFNESIWSVESLAPFIPSREWLLENGLLEPKVNEVIEETKHVEDSNKNDTIVNQKRKSCGLLSCVSSVQTPESCLCSSIQQEEQSPVKETETEIEQVESDFVEPEQSQNMLPSKKNVLSSCALPDKAISNPSERDENENRSSEHDSSHSPIQKSFCLNELQQTSLSSSEEEMSLNSAAEEIPSSAIQLNGGDTEDDGAPAKTEVSPSKGTLVDFGVQCNSFHERRCLCGGLNKNTETNRRLHFKSSDMKKKIDGRNGHMQKRKNSQWRSIGQEWQFNQQEAHSGYCRGGKSKGGRNSQYY